MHPPHTPLPTYNNASRTRHTPPTPDDASRMQYRHKTCATSPGPGPIVYVYIYVVSEENIFSTWLILALVLAKWKRRPLGLPKYQGLITTEP